MTGKRSRQTRKGNSKEFYDYHQNKAEAGCIAGLADLQPMKLDLIRIGIAGLKERLLLIQALETARCIEEGVVTDAAGGRCRLNPQLQLCTFPPKRHHFFYIDGMRAAAKSPALAAVWRSTMGTVSANINFRSIYAKRVRTFLWGVSRRASARRSPDYHGSDIALCGGPRVKVAAGFPRTLHGA